MALLGGTSEASLWIICISSWHIWVTLSTLFHTELNVQVV